MLSWKTIKNYRMMITEQLRYLKLQNRFLLQDNRSLDKVKYTMKKNILLSKAEKMEVLFNEAVV